MRSFILAVLVAGSVQANELTVGVLNDFCSAKEGSKKEIFCNAYILGIFEQRLYNCEILKISFNRTYDDASGIDTRDHLNVITKFLGNDFSGVRPITIANLFYDWSNRNKDKWDVPARQAFNRLQHNHFLGSYNCELKKK